MKSKAMWIAIVAALFSVAAAQNDPVSEELKKLEGTYKMVRGEEGGKPLEDDIVKTAKLTITGNKHVVQLGQETINGTHTVNPLEKPESIDASDTTGRFAGMTTKGIYKLEGDEFSVCFSPPDELRPSDFSTRNHPGRLMHVWRRVK
ncbi:MAG: TIGR03067 domain-containing protein [Planctomycetia bacterium]|nr:TIGR03067 domain-containing protein [Planctomycetia bacterium]